jgi:hypothetical protein
VRRVLVNGMQELQIDSLLPLRVAHMTHGLELSGRCVILLSSTGSIHSGARVRTCHALSSCASSCHTH